MRHHSLRTITALALVMTLTAAWAAAAPDDLQSQIEQLKSQLTAIESRDAAKHAEVNATIDAVLRDADSHSKLLAAGAGGAAGHGDIAPKLPPYGFSIVQGDFSLNISPAVQLRGVVNYAKERKNGGSDTQTGFELTRSRLALQGSAYGVGYYITWEGDIDGSIHLLDAILAYEIAPGLTLRAGQMKAAFAHEGFINAFDQLGATRSLLNGLLGIPDGLFGRTQGVGLWYGGMQDPVHVLGVFHDGCGSVNTNFQDNGINFGSCLGVAVKLMGDWMDYYTDMTARNTKQDLLVIGAGGDATQGDNYTHYRMVVDAQYKSPSKLSVFGAFQGFYQDPRNAADDNSTFDWGLMIQAGYAISDQIEPFARYSFVKFEKETAVGRKSFHEVTVGVNYFLGKNGSAGNNAKVTAELTWLPKGSPSPVAYNDIIGGTDKTELVFRTQLQFRP